MNKKDTFKQKNSEDAESFFKTFCQKNNINAIKLDSSDNNRFRNILLKNPNGKCPDYWCKKQEIEIFVEIKTLTNLTNQKRQLAIEENIKKIRASGEGFGLTTGVFNSIPELIGPFTTFLKDASNKFKNIKDDDVSPRILIYNKTFGGAIKFDTNAIFLGAFETYKKINGKLTNAGFQKTKEGIFDKTGSNVSAVIYWNKELNRYEGIPNHKAKISFSEELFNLFFVENKI